MITILICDCGGGCMGTGEERQPILVQSFNTWMLERYKRRLQVLSNSKATT